MITEDYISFEVAKLLKEKGFDEPCHALYHNGEDKIFFGLDVDSYHNTNLNVDYYACPTLQMAMKWLREVHKIHITIGYTFKADANLIDDYASYCFGVENAKTFFYHPQDEWYNTYEEACEAAMKYCLENLI